MEGPESFSSSRTPCTKFMWFVLARISSVRDFSPLLRRSFQVWGSGERRLGWGQQRLQGWGSRDYKGGGSRDYKGGVSRDYKVGGSRDYKGGVQDVVLHQSSDVTAVVTSSEHWSEYLRAPGPWWA